jgi:hypothetical protein
MVKNKRDRDQRKAGSCLHPTDALEVWPDGSGTHCHACGGIVDWSKDEETADGEGG